MKLFNMTLIPIASAALLLCAAGNASAGIYGYAYNNVSGLAISGTGGLTALSSVNSSVTAAILGAGFSTFGGPGVLDALQATVGNVTKGQNAFSPQGPGPQGNPIQSYSRADAQIVSTQFPSGSSTHAVNVAEAHIAFASPAGTGATALGRNGSTTAITFSTGAGVVNFDFFAEPYMQTSISSVGSGPASSATAGLVVVFSITNSTGAIVFNWSPDGVAGGILGGTESADPWSLNVNLPIALPTTSGLYDPFLCGAPSDATAPRACRGHYAASTASLASGNYTLTVQMVESVDLFKAPLVRIPVPDTLALLGLGLAGLGFVNRRSATAPKA